MGDKQSGFLSLDEIAGVVATPAEVRSGVSSAGRPGGYGALADIGYGTAKWLGQGAYNLGKTAYETPLGDVFDNIMGGLSGKGAEAQRAEGRALFGLPSAEDEAAAQPSAQDTYLQQILAEAEERKRRAALARTPGNRRAATGAVAPEADDPASRFTLDTAPLLAAENENLQPLPDAVLPDKPPAEYGTLEETLQFQNPREAATGTALDVASSLAPNPISRAEIITSLARTAPGMARWLLAHPRLANSAINAAREGAMGAGMGAFQEADPYTGGTAGAGFGALLPPSLGPRPGRITDAREALADSAERSARQRAGQAFSPSTDANKRFVERNWERMTREAPTWSSLEGVQRQAQREADAAGVRLEQAFDNVRQTNQTGNLRRSSAALTRSANHLLRSGVELAPETRANLETVVGALRGLNPRSTNLQTLQRAHGMVIDALHEVGRENARIGQLMLHNNVRQIFDQATQAGAVPSSRRAMITGGLGIEDVANEVAPSRVRTQPIINRLRVEQRRQFMRRTDRRTWQIHNQEGYNNLQNLIEQIAGHGDEVSIDTLRGIRQVWDDVAGGPTGKGFLVETISDASRRGAHRTGRNVIRGRMAATVPELVPENRAFSYNQNVVDITGDTLRRRTGHTKGPLAGIAATAGVGFGTRRGDDETSAGDALASMTAGALAWYATRFIKSPNWNLLSAKARLKIADALRRGNTTVLRHALARADGYLTRRAAGHAAPTFEQDSDLLGTESEEQMQRILGGYALEPGVTAPARDASEIPDPIDDGDEDDDNPAGVQPGIDPTDLGVPGVDPMLPGSLFTPEQHEAIEGEEAANRADPDREDRKAELQRAGFSGRELREMLRGGASLVDKVSQPLIDFPETGMGPLDKILGTAEQFTSPLDLMSVGTTFARPLLGTASRLGRVVEGVGRGVGAATALQGAEGVVEGVETGDPLQIAGGALQTALGAAGTRQGGLIPATGRVGRRLVAGLKAGGMDALVGPVLALGAEGVADDPLVQALIPDADQREQLKHWVQLGGAASLPAVLMAKGFRPKGAEVTTGSPRVVVDGREVPVVASRRAIRHNEALVTLDMGKADTAWQRDTGFHVGPGGQPESGGIAGRYERVGEFLKTAESMDAPEVSVSATGKVSFDDGRHRAAYLRDQGSTTLPVTMDAESLANARKHGLVSTPPVATANDETTGRRPKLPPVEGEPPEVDIDTGLVAPSGQSLADAVEAPVILGPTGEVVSGKVKAPAAGPIRLGVKATTRASVIHKAILGGGYSVDLKTGVVPDVGTFSGLYPNYDTKNVKVIPKAQFTQQHVKDYVAQMQGELRKPDRYLGGWVDTAGDTEAGKKLREAGDDAGAEKLRQASGDPSAQYPLGTELVYLDVPKRFADDTVKKQKGVIVPTPNLPLQIRQATKTGEGPLALDPNQATREAAAQKAVYTADKNIPAYLRAGGGFTNVKNWRSYIEGPVYERRYHEQAQRGAEWLKTQGGQQWWKLHGSIIEKVYGPELMEQAAGFLAATSPRTTVHENIRQASVYLQRVIKGEPLIQPGWRMTGGEHYGKSGQIQMPMETVRVAALEKAARGEKVAPFKTGDMQDALLGKPRPVTADTHHAKLGEDPTEGIYLNTVPGKISDEQYPIMSAVMQAHADARGQQPASYSANVWAGIIDTIQQEGNLYGTPYQLTASDATPLFTQFEQVLQKVATHHGYPLDEFIELVRKGDKNLMAALLSTGLGGTLYAKWLQAEEEREGGPTS